MAELDGPTGKNPALQSERHGLSKVVITEKRRAPLHEVVEAIDWGIILGEVLVTPGKHICT